MKKAMYIAGTVFLFLFVLVLILSFTFPERSTNYESTMGGCAIAGLCWLEIPSAMVPLKPVSLWKNSLKRAFQRFSALPLFRAILCAVASITSAFSVISIVLVFIDLAK